jgi:hypothetical protein
MANSPKSILLLLAPGEPCSAHLVEGLERALNTEVLARQTLGDRSAGADWTYESLGDASAFENALRALPDPIHVVLGGFGVHDRLPSNWIVSLGTREVLAIDRLVEDEGAPPRLMPHRPLANTRSEILSVFPGPIVPLMMGSHQRAFQLVAALGRAGLPVDVLVSGTREQLKRARPILYQVCPRVHTYRNKRRKLPAWMRARKGVEKRWRKMRGQSATGPDLFEERLANKATFSGRKQLRALADSDRYRAIIINYAWLEPIRDLVHPTQRARATWLCDTHDVQFMRGATNNRGEHRFAVSQERERRVELDVLRRFDKVIAISTADASALLDSLGGSRVIEAPTGFDYAVDEPRNPDPDCPVFGFIGGRMDANVKAVDYLFDRWWPAVHARWPKARLHLAGRICEVPRVRERAFLREDVELLGFVSSLREYYAGIDVLLNPVVVQGGLNFKSVEAIMSSTLLATTRLGAVCLGDEGLALVANDGPGLVEGLESALCYPERFVKDRIEVRRRAQTRFGDEVAYAQLVETLKRVGRPVRRTSIGRPSRVLIQSGGHLENRRRILPLARAVRERGHHPIVLAYRPEHAAAFVAQGVDAVALHDFDETRSQKLSRKARCKLLRNLASTYRGFDLDDLTAVDQMQRKARYDTASLPAALEDVARHIDRVLRVVDHVKPDQLYVWNGHTGMVANVLRQLARNRGLPSLFLERSLFPDGLFVDPAGTNGRSELCQLDADDLRRLGCDEASRSPADVVAPVRPEEVSALRYQGPWAAAERIVFVPLQVQSDTNVLLYSPEIKSMASLVREVRERFGGAGTTIVVRPHPEEVDDIEIPEMDGVYVDATGSLDAWLEAADHVVTINSTVGLTALLRRRPVTALGLAIYSGKGLTDGRTPERAVMEDYWRVLVNRHTALPERPPDVLSELLPKVERRRLHPLNAMSIDPDDARSRWENERAKVRARALEAGRLFLKVDLKPRDRLDLTYRKTHEEVTREWLEERAREAFDLPDSVSVTIGREAPKHAAAVLRVCRTSRAPSWGGVSVDRYLLPIPRPSSRRDVSAELS